VGNDLELFVMDADGSNQKQVTKLGGQNAYASFTPDSKKIAFHHAKDATSGTFYQIDPDGKNLKEILKDEKPIEGGRTGWK
jgi:TolB protein